MFGFSRNFIDNICKYLPSGWWYMAINPCQNTAICSEWIYSKIHGIIEIPGDQNAELQKIEREVQNLKMEMARSLRACKTSVACQRFVAGVFWGFLGLAGNLGVDFS